MRVALTGTPGTGKTTVASRLECPLEVVHLSDVLAETDVRAERDDIRGSDVIDIERLREVTADRDDVLFESHLSHRLAVDRVIVLRCAPDELESRLRERGMTQRSIEENAESEALDVILAEAVEGHGRDRVYEIDTTGRSLEAVTDDVSRAIDGTLEHRVGIVDFTRYL